MRAALALVYGPSAKGRLRAWRREFGGNLLDEYTNPAEDGFGSDWASRSIDAVERCVERQGKVHFDLTHMKDIAGVLSGKGNYAETVTAKELRFIRDNWDRFKDYVIFYKDNLEVSKPWQS